MEEEYYKLLNDVLNGYDRMTPKNISNLRNNQIFVFGTDTAGSQKNGAAGLAAKRFGAEFGVVDGPTGMCYALPTKGFSIEELTLAVQRFEQYVRTNFRYTFLVTAVGCGHAGFEVKTVANMFVGMIGLRNVMLPDAFLKVYREECKIRLNHNSAQNDGSKTDKVEDPLLKVLACYDESLHEVIRYLDANNIEFERDGGFCLTDDSGSIIAEAELGIESEKIVFSPFNSQSELAFNNAGYTIMSTEEYLKEKRI